MARDAKQLKIGKHEYKLLKLGGEQGAELWLDLLHLMVGPLESLAKAKDDDALDETVIVSAIAAGIRSLDHTTMRKFYKAFGPLSSVRVASGDQERWPSLEGAVFDDHFAGNYIELTEWVVQSVMFNFLGFFADGSLGAFVDRFMQMVPNRATTTPSTTT